MRPVNVLVSLLEDAGERRDVPRVGAIDVGIMWFDHTWLLRDHRRVAHLLALW